MRHAILRAALLAAFSALAPACQTEPGGSTTVARPHEPDGHANPPAARAAPGATQPPELLEPLEAPASVAPAGQEPLTLAVAVRRALEGNPGLAVARHREGVSRAALEVARTYPHNPQIQTDVRPYVRGADGKRGDVFVEAAILQEVELAGQGGHRERAGTAELAEEQWNLREKEWRAVAEAERRFFGAVYWRERRELEESQAQFKDELVGVLERRFAAGLATGGDVALARVEAESARHQLALTQLHEATALAELRKHLGATEKAAAELTGSLSGFTWTPPRVTSGAGNAGAAESKSSGDVDALLAARPDVKVDEAGRDAASARADLAAAERAPNVTLGPVYERDEDGTSFVGLKVELPIPVFSTGGPLVRQRRAEVEERSEALQQTRRQARAEIEAATARYERAFRLAERFGGDRMQGVEQDVKRVMDLYEAGVTSFLETYVAREKLAEARQNRLDAVYELALAAADLSEASALPPHALCHEPGGPAVEANH